MVAITLCALPLVLGLPQKVRVGMQVRDRGGIPHWPPYYAPALNSKTNGLKAWVDDNKVIFSDQPWAVAWYADRISVWLPPTAEGFLKIESIASELQTPVAGILISPSSHGSGPISEVAERYKDFTALVYDGRIALATYPSGYGTYDKGAHTESIAKRYPYRQSLVGMDMVYYSDHPIRTKEEKTSE